MCGILILWIKWINQIFFLFTKILKSLYFIQKTKDVNWKIKKEFHTLSQKENWFKKKKGNEI